MTKNFCDKCHREIAHAPPFRDAASGGFCIMKIDVTHHDGREWVGAELCAECIVELVRWNEKSLKEEETHATDHV